MRVRSTKSPRKSNKAGALDQFGHRSAMLAGLDRIREMGTSINKMKNSGQSKLFEEEAGSNERYFPELAEFEKAQN